MRPRIMIDLFSKTPAFSLNDAQYQRLCDALPQADVVRCMSKEESSRERRRCDIAVVWTFDGRWYAENPSLYAVFTPAAGRESVHQDPAGRAQTNYGTFHGHLMAESLLAMMLFFNTRLMHSLDAMRAHAWDRDALNTRRTLSDQHVLFIGYGEIARHAARICSAFGCRITGVKRDVASGGAYAGRIIGVSGLDDAPPSADHVVLILPSDTGTDGMFDARRLSLMKHSAFLYNLGRGNCVSDADIARALADGSIAGAYLDVFSREPLDADSPLWNAPRCVITPHASALYAGYLDRYLDELLPRLAAALTVR